MWPTTRRLLVLVSTWLLGLGASTPPLLGLGSKRPFALLDEPLAADDEGTPQLGTVVYLALVARHGARYPTKHKLAGALALARRLSGATYDDEVAAWANRTVAQLERREPGELAPRGLREMRTLAQQLARRFGADAFDLDSPQLDVSCTTSRRTTQSCLAFFGLDAHARCEAADDPLLRPYHACPALQATKDASDKRLGQRMAVLDDAVRARAAQLLSAGPGLLPGDGAAAWHACQLAHTLEDLAAAADASPPCQLVGPWRHNLSVLEDVESFEQRGFEPREPIARDVMAPLLRRLTAELDDAAASRDGDAPSTCPQQRPHRVSLYFAHDSTLLPLVALMGLLDFGPDAERSRAAYHCPFASRLVLAMDDHGRIELTYNGRVVRRLDLREWHRLYDARARVDATSLCRRQIAS